MGSFGRSIGDFGSQVGGGFDINQGWQQRAQQMAIENARAKIAQMQAPLQLQELQQRIKAMQQPQAQGTVALPNGGRGGVTFQDGVYSIQNLVPGAPPEPKFTSLQQAAAYYLQKGDLEKLKQVNDEIEKTKPPKVESGYSDIKTDTKGNMWGTNKTTGKFEQIQVPKGTQFPVPREPADPNALYDRWVKEQQYKADHPVTKSAKPFPPDVQALLTAPVPKTPTAEQSRRLADAADRVFGGTAYKQDLITRGRRSPWLGLRSPYEAATYEGGEYSNILDLIKNAAGQQQEGGGDSIPPPPEGFVINK